jgi:NitT/TauT family transport system substrate-binding protein
MANRPVGRYIVLVGLLVLSVAAYFVIAAGQKTALIRLGISPYQDTAIPVISKTEGIFSKNGLDVELVTIPWENIVPALASRGRTIDVAIGSINTFLPRAAAVNDGQADPVVFYAPLYVFKGASFVARADSGLKSFKALLKEANGDRTSTIKAFAQQMVGKKIGYPSGTPYEQMFLEVLRQSGSNKAAFDIRDVQLAEGLPALLSGVLDIAAAGVTQRTEALRRGNVVLLEIEDLGFAEIIGLMTTRSYYESNREQLESLRKSWFETIQALRQNPQKNTRGIIEYLAQNASTKYSFDEYMAALGAQEFPLTEDEADAMFMEPAGRFYWRRTWDLVNQYLIETGQIKVPVSTDYYVRLR